jgi:FkbM family methyltransferase
MRSFLIDLTPPIMARALRRFRNRNEPNSARVIAQTKAEHRLYDRFLPVLCRHIPRGWIIDVGANVGTTAEAMAKECDNPILCIEGNPDYFIQLLENTKHLPVRCVRALAGTGKVGGSLVSGGGTARLVRGPTESNARPVDAILQEAEISFSEVALLKTDTDGSDGDVILSTTQTLRGSEPLLFWENDFSDEIEEQEFDSAYEHIMKLGYSHFWAFDNFGNIMLSECSYPRIRDLNRYVASQKYHACTRTIYYIDVLAATDQCVVHARNAIADYRTNAIER